MRPFVSKAGKFMFYLCLPDTTFNCHTALYTYNSLPVSS